jgi:hypothetical protein
MANSPYIVKAVVTLFGDGIRPTKRVNLYFNSNDLLKLGDLTNIDEKKMAERIAEEAFDLSNNPSRCDSWAMKEGNQVDGIVNRSVSSGDVVAVIFPGERKQIYVAFCQSIGWAVMPAAQAIEHICHLEKEHGFFQRGDYATSLTAHRSP